MRRVLTTILAFVLLSALTGNALAGGGGIGVGGDDGGGGSGEDHVFPIVGKHTYGDGYGAGRGHRGQDLFARCGKKLRAVRKGRVKYRDYQGSAGHYIVVDGAGTARDFAYMHLRGRSPLRKGERVRTGQYLGRVGQSGNASGCHLHFELWRGDWNGRPDVTRKLKQWDKYS